MHIEHRPVVIDGQRLGDLVSCDRRYRFYTTDSDLSGLDGRAFDGVDEALAAIKRALAVAGRLKPAMIVPAALAGPTSPPSPAGESKRKLGAAVAMNAVARPKPHAVDLRRDLDAP